MTKERDVSAVYARIVQRLKASEAHEAMHARRVRGAILVFLLSALVVSWVLKSRAAFTLGLVCLLLCIFFMGLGKLERAIYAFQRRRELERMPLFSLRGDILRMEENNAVAQEKSLDELEWVLVITTDQGPFVCDSALNLVFRDGAIWSVPLENPSCQALYDALNNALSFDHEQGLIAACSITDGIFSLWAREGTDVSGS